MPGEFYFALRLKLVRQLAPSRRFSINFSAFILDNTVVEKKRTKTAS